MKGNTDAAVPLSKRILFGGILLVVALAGALLVLEFRQHPPKSAPAPVADSPAPEPPAPGLVSQPAIAPRVPDPVPPTPTPVTPPASAPSPAEPRDAHLMVSELADISGSRDGVTPEQAAKFKQNLEDLIRQGPASVPAIQEMLRKNLDSDFAELAGGDQLSYPSMRAALLDALKQIGGPEAQGALVEVLQTTAISGELLAVANSLEQQAPGQYRQQILDAARQVVEMASSHPEGNTEYGPAFHLLQMYGDDSKGGDTAEASGKKSNE